MASRMIEWAERRDGGGRRRELSVFCRFRNRFLYDPADLADRCCPLSRHARDRRLAYEMVDICDEKRDVQAMNHAHHLSSLHAFSLYIRSSIEKENHRIPPGSPLALSPVPLPLTHKRGSRVKSRLDPVIYLLLLPSGSSGQDPVVSG